MTRRISLAAALAAALLACSRRAAEPPAPPVITLSQAEVEAVKNPHAPGGGRNFCWSCHHDDRGRALRADPVAVCRRCHSLGKHGNHPVDVLQKFPSGALPLWKRERLVCHTCHAPHDIAASKEKYALRLDFNQLCIQCHPGGGSMHHGQHAGGPGKQKAPPSRPAAPGPGSETPAR